MSLGKSIIGLAILTSSWAGSTAVKADTFTVCNKGSNTFDVSIALKPHACSGVSLGRGCFGYHEYLEIKGWYNVHGKSCKDITLPERRSNDIYIAIQANGVMVSDETYKTNKGATGGYRICANRTKRHDYVQLNNGGGYDFDGCHLFGSRNRGGKMWDDDADVHAPLKDGIEVLPFILFKGKYKKYTFSLNTDHIKPKIKVADRKPAPTLKTPTRPAPKPVPKPAPAEASDLELLSKFSPTSCGLGRNGKYFIQFDNNIYDNKIIPITTAFLKACGRYATLKEAANIEEIAFKGNFGATSLKLYSGSNLVHSQSYDRILFDEKIYVSPKDAKNNLRLHVNGTGRLQKLEVQVNLIGAKERPVGRLYSTTVTCESRLRGTTFCPVPGAVDAIVETQLSSSKCRSEKFWVNSKGLFVTSGCRAEFRVNYTK